MPEARSLNLAVDRGRGDLDVAAIVVAFGLAAAAVLSGVTRDQPAERARSTPTGPSHAAFT